MTLTFSIYTLLGFLSTEFWQYVLKPKVFKDNPHSRLVFSFGSGVFLAAVVLLISELYGI